MSPDRAGCPCTWRTNQLWAQGAGRAGEYRGVRGSTCTVTCLMISTLDEIHSLCPRRSLVSSVNNHRWISKQIFFALLQCNVHVRFTLWTWVYILSSHFWDGQSFLHKQTQNLTITCTNCTFCRAQDKSLKLDSIFADIFTLYLYPSLYHLW